MFRIFHIWQRPLFQNESKKKNIILVVLSRMIWRIQECHRFTYIIVVYNFVTTKRLIKIYIFLIPRSQIKKCSRSKAQALASLNPNQFNTIQLYSNHCYSNTWQSVFKIRISPHTGKICYCPMPYTIIASSSMNFGGQKLFHFYQI